MSNAMQHRAEFFGSELRENFALARPLIALHAGQQLMPLLDTLMLARVSTTALAGAGIGSGLFLAVSVIGTGLLLGLDPLIAQAAGAGETERARAYARRGCTLALLLSGPLALLLALLPLGLPRLGVPTEIASETAGFVWARALGLPFLLLSVALRSYLQAVLCTRPIVLGVVVSSLCNVPLNWILIFGSPGSAGSSLVPGGLPALGSLGAGLANSIATAVGLLMMYRAWPKQKRPHGTKSAGPAAADFVSTRAILRLGGPLALQLFAEVCVYVLGAIFIGRLGPAASAGHAVAVSIASFPFGVALAVSAAASVRIGQAVGRGDHRAARRAGLAGLVNVWCMMGVAAIVFYCWPDGVAGWLATRPETLAAAVPLLKVAALFQISDGTQAVAAGALRGIGDTVSGLLANLLGHYAVGLPAAIGLGLFTPLGASGVWIGLSIGMVVAVAWLLRRFIRLSGGPIARAEQAAG